MIIRALPYCTPKLLQKAHYATVAHDHWPQSGHSSKAPTPYEILNTHPRQPYTKERFNELVKLYHPDRTVHPSFHICAHLSSSERLERYRLIVAAHALLSDPVKRKAYDTFGIGWVDGPRGMHDIPVHRQRSHSSDSGEAWGNATWEDWEQYHYKKSNEGRKPQYATSFSNANLVSMMLAFAILGGAAQHQHAESLAASRIALREERHAKATREFAKAKEVALNSTREGRIESFMRQRDEAVLGDAKLSELVMNPDLCESGDAVGRGDKDNIRRKWK